MAALTRSNESREQLSPRGYRYEEKKLEKSHGLVSTRSSQQTPNDFNRVRIHRKARLNEPPTMAPHKEKKRRPRCLSRILLSFFTLTIVGGVWLFISQITNLDTEVLRAIAADHQQGANIAKQAADAQVNNAQQLSKTNSTSNLRREQVQVKCGGHLAPSCQECPQVRPRWIGKQHSVILHALK